MTAKGELMTYKQMCEDIVSAEILHKEDGTMLTPRDVFEYSPRGELFMIPIWYEQAKIILNDR
jgi:hypothetical protein